MDLNSINPNNPYQYFNFDLNNPDAIVILNRGTRFEKDITNDIRAATTSNSVDSIAGSFSITLDNTNDIYVDRFGHTSVKAMSAIEIFAKSLSAHTTPTNLATESDSTQIPASVGNLNDFINIYFNNPSSAQSDSYKKSIMALNADRKSPFQTYTINTSNNGLNGIKDVSVTSSTIKIVFNDDLNVPVYQIVYHQIINQSYPNIIFTIFPQDIQKITQPFHNVNMTNIIVSSANIQSDPIVDNDFVGPGEDRMNNLRQSPIKVPQQQDLYQRIFFGIVLNVSQNINPGSELTINLTGKSIGYWLEATPVNIHPGGFETTLNNLDLTAYSNRYATTNAMDIFRDLIRFSTDDLIAVTDFNTDTLGTSSDVIEVNGVINKSMLDVFGNPIKIQNPDGTESDLTAKYAKTRPTQQINELDARRKNLYNGIPYNNNDSTSTSNSITKNARWTALAQAYRSNTNALNQSTAKMNEQLAVLQSQADAATTNSSRNKILAQQQKVKESSEAKIARLNSAIEQNQEDMNKIPEVQIQQKAIDQQISQLQQDVATLMKAGRSNILNQVGIIDHWKNIFGKMILEVVDNNNFLGLVYPLKIAFSDPDASMDGDYITKADMANMVAQNLMYEFYVDTNGHFVLKPPLYNIGIQPDNPDYIIEETDLISMSINESVEGIITRIGVTGDYNEPVTLEKIQIYNIHQDLNLIRDYGFHAQEIAGRLFLRNNADCRDFGKSYMTKNNMELNSASVTINGRSGIRLGTSVYLKPRDTMYYIKEINHEISAGGQFQTTLTLIGARKIITGFKAQSNLTTITQKTNLVPNPDNTGLDVGTKQTFNYILASAVNQEAITDANIKTAPNQFDREQRLSDAQIQAVVDNPNTTSLLNNSVTPSDMVNQKTQINGLVPQILRNVYQITSHINPAYIGLIVDQNAEAISDINIANYNFFANLSVDSIGESTRILNIPKNKQAISVSIIKDAFDLFVADMAIGNPNQFTIALRDQFILSFLKSTSDQINSKNITGGSVNSNANDIATACTVFNQLINQVDNGGVYRQFTDNDGRELPSYFDYGKSLLIESNQLTVAQFTNMSQISAQQKRDSEAKRKATQAKGYQSKSKVGTNINIALQQSLAAINRARNPQPIPKSIPGPVPTIGVTQ